jgi:GntR family transcriptional regulator
MATIMPLQISISTGSPLPIYRQIAAQIRRAMATRQLLPGEQLPSVRALAEDLVINPNTVARTYADLIRDGILEAQKAKGVFVAQSRPVYTKSERLRKLDAHLEAFVNEGLVLGFSPDELTAALEKKLRQLAADIEKGAAHE